MGNKAYSMDSRNIHELTDRINEFGKTHRIVATQVFLNGEFYDCIIWYEEKTAEPIYEKKLDKDEPATSKQIYALEKMGVKIPKGLTKREAYMLIKSRKEGK